MTKKPDASVDICGSIGTLTPLTKSGHEWVAKNVHAESWQRSGPSIYVEPRMLIDIAEAMERDGLTVSR